MYLKESFRYQNFLSDLLGIALDFLGDRGIIMTRKELHMRKKANPEAEDEEIITEKPVDYTADELISFVLFLTVEKEKLSAAISEAKKNAPIDIDTALAGNNTRKRVAEVLKDLAQRKSSETLTTNRDYKFNAEGNQVAYQYQTKVVLTIDYDRNKVKKISKDLALKSDELSTAIDKAMVEVEVEYVPEFNVNDSFEDVLEAFLEKKE